MRGDYEDRPHLLADGDRAIPTCVGTTAYACPHTRAQPGHPHVRGDYALEVG